MSEVEEVPNQLPAEPAAEPAPAVEGAPVDDGTAEVPASEPEQPASSTPADVDAAAAAAAAVAARLIQQHEQQGASHYDVSHDGRTEQTGTALVR